MTHRKYLKKKKKIVVKVGTSLLAYDNGKINLQRMEKLVRVLADLHNTIYIFRFYPIQEA